MYILYIDGSGTPDLGANGDIYALLGICVHEGTWFALQKRFAGLKRKFEFPGIPFELHAKDFCLSLKEQDKVPDFGQLDYASRRSAVLAIRAGKLKGASSTEEARAMRKRFKSTDPFVHLTRQERSQLLEDALDTVGSHDGIRLFGEVVHKPYLFRATGKKDSLEHAFAQLVARFDAFLTRENGPGHSNDDKGMLMMDREPTAESLLQKLFSAYRERGHPWGAVNHVIEAPFFVDSAKVAGVQAVDLCSYAVRRYVERATTKNSFEEKNFLRIFHRFDRAGPRLHGLRHYCARGSCPCRVCLERGHTETTEQVA